MGYIYILIASLAVGGQFSLSKVYKRLTPDSGYTDLFYNFAMGVFSVVLFAVVCLGKVGFNTFSFALAAAVAVANHNLFSLRLESGHVWKTLGFYDLPDAGGNDFSHLLRRMVPSRKNVGF